MRRLRLRVDTSVHSAPIGHNSLDAEFKYRKGEVAPHVTTRERGVIPGCYPGDISTYHTGAEANSFLHYLHPNACHYPPKQDEGPIPRKPIEQVLERAEKIADQIAWAVQTYAEGGFPGSATHQYQEAQRYLGAKTILPRPKTKLRVFA